MDNTFVLSSVDGGEYLKSDIVDFGLVVFGQPDTH